MLVLIDARCHDARVTKLSAREVAVGEIRSTDIWWGWIALLMTAVLATLVAYAVGVALPYHVNDVDAPPANEVAGGVYDQTGLWPQNEWTGTVLLIGFLAVTLGPFVFLTALPFGVGCLAVLGLRPVPHRVWKMLCLSVVVALSAAALAYLLWGTGRTMSGWRLG